MLPTLSGEFTLVADPELRFSPSGVAVCKMRLVADKQRKDGDQWVDDKVLYLDATCFKKQADNVAESCVKGTKVTVVGKLQTEEWKDRETNEPRSRITLIVDDIGVSLRFDSATVNRAQRASHGAAQAPATDPWGVQPDGRQGAPGADPWATPPANDDQPPF